MANIRVQSRRDYELIYGRADKWVIDDEGRLHVVGNKGNLASFHRDEWASVDFAEDTP